MIHVGGGTVIQVGELIDKHQLLHEENPDVLNIPQCIQ